MSSMGRELTRLREEKGYSKSMLARKSGIQTNTVINIEKGRVTAPNVLVLLGLSENLGVTLDHWTPFLKEDNKEEA